MQKLRIQLIALLVIAVLLPAIPVAWTTHDLIHRSLDPLLNAGIEEGARAGLASLRSDLNARKQQFAAAIEQREPVDTLSTEDWDRFEGKEKSLLEGLEQRPLTNSEPTRSGPLLAGPERTRLDGREILIAKALSARGEARWVVDTLPAEMAPRAERLTASLQLIESLRRERGTVARGLLGTFLVVYAVVVGLVLMLGLYFASRIIRPIRVLGAGIVEVAEGRLETRIEEIGGGEMQKLLHDFNEMAVRLQSQQAEVMRLERMAAWQQMARRLAHEIKNPLTPIQLSAQQIRDESDSGRPDFRQLVVEATSIIEEEVERLRKLVAQFSQFARPAEPHIVETPIQEILTDLQNLYGAEKVTIELPPMWEDVRIACDRDQIHRVLINLVNNAITAQEQIGRFDPIEVAVVDIDQSGSAFFEVRDHGPGVAPENRRRIFEPDVTTRPDGMGLGLAIVEGSIRNHGGLVDVRDRSGGGAVFAFHLRGDLLGGGGRQE